MTPIRIRPWSEPDAPLLVAANTADMTSHIAGPETDEQVAQRHRNYLRFWEEDSAHMFAVFDGDEPVGGIGWWRIDRGGVAAAETGWFVLPRAQGRGVARAAVLHRTRCAREPASTCEARRTSRFAGSCSR